jgi:hypothetical protein
LNLARLGQDCFVSFLCMVIFGVFAAPHRGVAPRSRCRLPSMHRGHMGHGWVRWHALCAFNERPRWIAIVWSPREQGEHPSRHPFAAMGRPSRAVSERCNMERGTAHAWTQRQARRYTRTFPPCVHQRGWCLIISALQ